MNKFRQEKLKSLGIWTVITIAWFFALKPLGAFFAMFLPEAIFTAVVPFFYVSTLCIFGIYALIALADLIKGYE